MYNLPICCMVWVVCHCLYMHFLTQFITVLSNMIIIMIYWIEYWLLIIEQCYASHNTLLLHPGIECTILAFPSAMLSCSNCDDCPVCECRRALVDPTLGSSPQTTWDSWDCVLEGSAIHQWSPHKTFNNPQWAVCLLNSLTHTES